MSIADSIQEHVFHDTQRDNYFVLETRLGDLVEEYSILKQELAGEAVCIVHKPSYRKSRSSSAC